MSGQGRLVGVRFTFEGCELDLGRYEVRRHGEVIAVALIPGSRFVTLESPNHLLPGDEPAWPRFVDEVAAFLAELT